MPHDDHPEEGGVQKPVTNVSKELRRVIGEDIELPTVTDPNLGRIKADPTQVEQILMNLAVNARDSMPHGGRLTIETMNVDVHDTGMRPRPVMSPGAYVVLRVSDTGTGIPPDVLPSIFEPFCEVPSEAVHADDAAEESRRGDRGISVAGLLERLRWRALPLRAKGLVVLAIPVVSLVMTDPCPGTPSGGRRLRQASATLAPDLT